MFERGALEVAVEGSDCYSRLQRGRENKSNNAIHRSASTTTQKRQADPRSFAVERMMRGRTYATFAAAALMLSAASALPVGEVRAEAKEVVALDQMVHEQDAASPSSPSAPVSRRAAYRR